MKQLLQRKIFQKGIQTLLLVTGLALTLSAALAPAAQAGIVPCGLRADDPETPDSVENAPCTLCHLIVGVKRVMDWGLSIALFFSVAVIVAMGVLYIISVGDQGQIKTAKEGLKATLYGFSLMLLAYLIVAVILATFARSLSDFGAGPSWFDFKCSLDTQLGTHTDNSGNVIANPGSSLSGSTGQSYSFAKCKPVTGQASNPCSVDNLKGTCMENHANVWSATCQGESMGNRNIGSGADVCADGHSASWGLFQINITVHKVAGLNCPKAFSSEYTAKNHSCRVIDTNLYNQCVAAAKDAKNNIEVACGLSKNGNNTGPWGAARACGFPKSL